MGPSGSGVVGLMGGPGVLAHGTMVGLGWSACYASVISCFWLPGESCGRVRRAWKAPALAGLGKHSLFPGSRIDGHFLAGCRRAPLGRLTQLERRICTFPQPWRRRRAARWPRERGKALQGRTPPARADRPRRVVSGPTAATLKSVGPRGAPRKRQPWTTWTPRCAARTKARGTGATSEIILGLSWRPCSGF